MLCPTSGRSPTKAANGPGGGVFQPGVPAGEPERPGGRGVVPGLYPGPAHGDGREPSGPGGGGPGGAGAAPQRQRGGCLGREGPRRAKPGGLRRHGGGPGEVHRPAALRAPGLSGLYRPAPGGGKGLPGPGGPGGLRPVPGEAPADTGPARSGGGAPLPPWGGGSRTSLR